jgi:Na+-driven multidrug efflux pump
VTGAALATFISILVADVLMVIYFEKKYHYLRFRFPLFRPQTKIWSGMLRIGVPAGAEFMLLFVTSCLFTQSSAALDQQLRRASELGRA